MTIIFLVLVEVADAARGLGHPSKHNRHHNGIKALRGHHHVLVDTNASKKRALRCYVGDSNELGDLEDCGDGEDKCLVRYFMDPLTKRPKDDKVIRYCSTADTCKSVSEDFFAEITHEGTRVAKCCGSEGCNGGVPAQIPTGIYWIQLKESEKFVKADSDGSLKESDFTNMDDIKFDIAQVAKAGSDLDGQFTIAPHGIVDDSGSTWSMVEVGKDMFMITGQTDMGLMPIVGRDFFAKFKLTGTVGGNWEVGWKDKRCPQEASREIPSAKDAQTCMNECKQDAACKEIIEWDNDNNRCFFVTQDCNQDKLRDGVGFYIYKSKCAGVECPAISQCHLAGVCDVTNGQCSTPLMAENAACDDGDHTTTNDICKAGACAGVNLCADVTCAADGQCFDVGTCNYGTGKCETKYKPGGTPCDDEDVNTKDDQCNLGVCKGTDPCADVTCEPLDQCHEAGVCLFATGTCDDKRKADGTECDDGDSTTKDDKCFSGVCRGKSKCEDVTCVAMGPCYAEGTCDPETGRCSDPFADSGAVCDDESDFTVDDVCDGKGGCFGQDLCAEVSCADMVLDQCMIAGACDRLTGQCTSQPKQNGVQCDDGDEKTSNDVCVSGECKGEDLCLNVQCPPINDCYEAGECKAGLCVDKVKADDEPCNDQNDFTNEDKCHAGVCVGVEIAQDEPDLGTDWFEEASETAEDQVVVAPKMVSSMGMCTKLFTNWEKAKGKSQDLRKHSVQCPPNQVMRGWKLKRDKKKIQVMYKCCDLSLILDTCEEQDTGFASNKKGKADNLADHMVQCSAGSVMSGWQLQNTGKGQIKFIYNCCAVKSPGLGACTSDKTDKTKENKKKRIYKLRKHKAMCAKDEVMTGWKYLDKGSKISVKYDCCKVPMIEEPVSSEAALLQYPQHQALIDMHDHLGPYEMDEDEFGEEDDEATDEAADEADEAGEDDEEEFL